MQRNYFVICKECNLEHSTSDLKAVNIEEDIEGRDVFTFECPVTNKVTSSLVFAD